VPRKIFTVAQLAHFVGIASLFKHWSDFALAQCATRRAGIFLFLKIKNLPKISPIV
jgi:hypothetical protein